MKVTVKYGTTIIHETLSTDEVMQKRNAEQEKVATNPVMKVKVLNGNTVISSTADEKAIRNTPVVEQPLMKVSVKNGNNTIIAPSCNNTTPSNDVLLNTNISPFVIKEIKEVEDKINAEVAAVDEDTKVIVELEIVHDDETPSTEPEVTVEKTTTEEDEEFEPVSEDDQSAIDSIISSRDEDYDDEDDYDDYPDEEEEEPKEEVSKYEEYDDEYGRNVKVNKVSKFKGNKDKFNNDRVESKFIKSNKR